MGEGNKGREDIERLEYGKAQDSAEHYNTMLWTLVWVGIGFSLILLRFTFSDLSGKSFFILSEHSLQSLMVFIGLFVIIYFSYLIEGANEKKNFKYGICKIIEKGNKYFYGQNLKTEILPISKIRYGIVFFRALSIALVVFYFVPSLFIMEAYRNTMNNLDFTNLILPVISFLGQIYLVYIFLKMVVSYRKHGLKLREILGKIERNHN